MFVQDVEKTCPELVKMVESASEVEGKTKKSLICKLRMRKLC